MANKITKKQMFNMILEVAEVASNPTMVEFINHEIDLLDRKRSSGKMTATQVENERIKDIILDTLEGQNPVTVSELQTLNEELGGYQNQKISALLRQLVQAELVVKTVDKKRSLFAKA